MYTTIMARCVDQTLQLTNIPKVASGGENVVRVEVTFDSSWDGYGKTAVFHRKGGRVYHVVMVDDACIVPREVLTEPGTLYFSLLGVLDNSTRTAEEVVLTISQGPSTGLKPFEPLPDVYKQVLSAEGANAQAIKVERARLDNLVAGGTVDDAELLDARVGVDGETYPNAGTAIRTQMAAKAGIYDVLQKRPGKNLFDKSAATAGFFVNSEGELGENASYHAGEYIPVTEGTSYTLSPLANGGGYVCFYNHAYAMISGFALSTLYNAGSGAFSAPEGARYIRFSILNADVSKCQFEAGAVATSYENYYEYRPLVELSAEVDNCLRKEMGKNLFDAERITEGYYLNGDGTLIANEGSFASDFIRVEPGAGYVFNTTGGGGRYVCFYTDAKSIIVGAAFTFGTLLEAGSGAFTVPETATYMRFSNFVDSADGIQLEKGTESTEYEPYYEYKPLHDVEQRLARTDARLDASLGASGGETLTKAVATLNAGETIEIQAGDVKKNKRLSFYGKVSSFSGLRLGHGLTAYGGSYIEIDATAVKVYQVTSEATLITSADHGLTISQYISVVINCQNNADVIVTTGAGTYRLKGVSWSGCNGPVFAASVGSVLTDCKLAWCCSDTRAKAWVFGDSYLNLTNADRFGKHVVDAGFTDWLASGYPGAGAGVQLNSFRNLLGLGLPKYAAFLLGMNNPDSGAVDTGWQSAVEGFVQECEARGIVPVLATIPSVPDRDHTYKNAYVRASGYRYIDWEQAVGAHESTAWYAGMLSTDNVHPTEQGARALAGRFMSDFPEIMM